MKLRLINEATVEDVQRRIPVWIKKYFGGDESKAGEIIPDIIASDPTKGKYSEWLIRQWKNKTARFPEDNEKLSRNLELFEQKKSRLDNKDINAYTPGALAETLSQQFKATGSERRDARKGGLQLPTGAELVVDKDGWKAVKIITPEASSILCSGTEWCVANEETAQEYLDQGPLYLIYINDQRRFLAHYESNQFMDVYDNDVSLHIKLSIIDFLKPVTGRGKEDISSVAFECAKDMGGRFRAGEAAIAKDQKYAVGYAEEIIGGRWPEAELFIAKDPSNAFNYAERVVKGRWPAGEKAIAIDGFYSYMYARDVINDRWPAGEKAIAKSHVANKYAEDVIKGRWPEAEPEIAKNRRAAYPYAKNVIKGRWPEAEPEIMSDASYALRYAVEIIKGRWPEAEPIIMSEQDIAQGYKKFLNQLNQ